MKNFKLKIKSFLAVLLIATSVIPLLLPMKVEAASDAATLSKTYLSLIKGTKLTSIDTINALSTEDLRVLSLLASNLYVPFATALDGESATDNTEHMAEVFLSMGIDRDAAKQLSQKIFEESLLNVSDLYIKFSDSSKYSLEGGSTPSVDAGTFQNTNYTNHVGSVKTDSSGGMYTPLTLFLWNCIVTDVSSTKDKSVSFYWDNGGTMQECFTLDHTFLYFFTEGIRTLDASVGDLGNAAFGGDAQTVGGRS